MTGRVPTWDEGAGGAHMVRYRVVAETVSDGRRIYQFIGPDGSLLIRSYPLDQEPPFRVGASYTLLELQPFIDDSSNTPGAGPGAQHRWEAARAAFSRSYREFVWARKVTEDTLRANRDLRRVRAQLLSSRAA